MFFLGAVVGFIVGAGLLVAAILVAEMLDPTSEREGGSGLPPSGPGSVRGEGGAGGQAVD